jgi:serine/threonine protein kinase
MLAGLVAPCEKGRVGTASVSPPPPELLARLRRLWSSAFPFVDATAPECWPKIEGYEILGVLGRGGMGIVYRARQKDLGREVALKMLAAGEWSSAAEVRRLLHDAEMAAQLRHDHIVPVYAVGQYRGLPFCVMELIAGGSLVQRVADLVTEPREAARLIAAVAWALHYAHLHGICHRDIKPANILLRVRYPNPPAVAAAPNFSIAPPRPRLGDLDACVSDFGLARRTQDEAGLTQTGAVVGTPGYMAPEQIRSERPAPAADVYGLGAVLYECLTGHSPLRAATSFDTLLLTLNKDPERPRVLNSRLPRDLETICLKCLEKEPQRRYHSAAAVADDLERWLRGESVRARPVGPLGWIWRWGRRKPVIASLVAAIVLAVVGGLATSLGLWRRAVTNESRALTGEAQARENLGEAEAARQDAEDNFTLIRQILDENVRVSDKPSLQAPAASPERLALLLKAEAGYTRLVQKRPRDQKLRVQLSWVLATLGAYHVNQGQQAESLACFAKAARLFEELPSEEMPEPEYLEAGVYAHLYLGHAHEREGRPGPAEQAFASALRLWQELARQPLPLDQLNDAFHVGRSMAFILSIYEHSEEGIWRRFESLRGRPGLLGGAEQYDLFLDLLRAELLHHRAERTGPPSALLAAAREAATILGRHLEDVPRDRNCRFALARSSLDVSAGLRKGGAPEEALRLAEPANRTLQTLVRQGPETGFLFVVLSSSWLEVGKIRGDLDQAEETLAAYRGAVEAQRQALDLAPGEPVYRNDLGHRYLQLMRRLCELGRLDEAVDCYQAYLTLWPGNAARHAEALREVRGWAVQVGKDKDNLAPAEQQKRQRYLDLGLRLEGKGFSMDPAIRGAKP